MATQTSKRTLTYGRHSSLQTITATPLEQHKDGYWVIYIHGGAWRDPTITAESIEPTQSNLQASPELPITGLASIEYRLSAHPNHPQDKATTPPEQYRNAKHPDHIRDVEAALAFLQNTYNFGQRYILVGHSCGATLAFQAVMGAVAGHREQLFNGSADESDQETEPVTSSPEPLPPRLSAHPTAIVGVAGIYDLRQIVETHRDISEYRRFVEGAFGADELLWDAVSPAQMVGSRGVEGGWKTGRLVVLAHSKDDELVDQGQLETMREALRAWEDRKAQVSKQELTSNDRRVQVLSLTGEHDEAWSKGEELARAVRCAFEELRKMGLSP
ncbi:uncharacterized protein N7473_011832 [Penicillium subrubescens]|uniref:Kynurenine formamidase n=1 Tax=Penicillium subrubescens TaxID=1316194 RepID=A0A1Q5UI53_9EURO|nr:uncharacterized protein N7473_011832 [Penicillium subrubescens]KAJ5880779.1 hypothetical protein N7473_011832 [Penicillium subrubescens]OKP12144.1 Kynurenine formamidase [Penicillium subrubescens]